MTAQTIDNRIERAIAGIDTALTGTICDMAPVIVRRYKLTGNECLTATAFAISSCASKMLAARVDTTPESGMELHRRLQAVMAEWLKEHGDV